jgi:hypothetical protein
MPRIWPRVRHELKRKHDMTAKVSMPLMERYRLAVTEFRAAYAQLAADDQRAGRAGFGPPPSIVELRHAIANPNEAGSLADDIAKLR